MTTETLDPETIEEASALAQINQETAEVLMRNGIMPRVRKKRSDAGKAKPPKPVTAAPAGVLSAEQGLTLRRLIDEQDKTRITLEQCERKFRDSCARLNEFIDRISS
jgi:hypothetical protein